jgi:hypothetical protein
VQAAGWDVAADGSPEERTHLAEAYVATTTNPIVGTDQTSETFRASLLKALNACVHLKINMRPAAVVIAQRISVTEYE